MATVQVMDQTGKKVKNMNVPDEIYSFPKKDHLIYESVINYRSNQRSGTASTKTRSDVRGGGRKPWRQKGTGRARAGSTRSPLWRTGGTTFGPQPKDYSYSIPKKAKKNALKSALSLRVEEDRMVVLESLEFKEPKTQEGAKLMKNLNITSAVIVDSHENKPLFLSLRNIPKVKAVDSGQLTVYDILNHDWLVMTKRAFDALTERLK